MWQPVLGKKGAG
uniref:Uncharacterized protein n=1 Tax=Arundo donax TaxID=35708 RepID=A0A0A9A9P0_ARUDO